MILFEVNSMEDNQKNTIPEDEGYVERPAWQVWGARVALVIFIGFVILQIWQIAGGGL